MGAESSKSKIGEVQAFSEASKCDKAPHNKGNAGAADGQSDKYQGYGASAGQGYKYKDFGAAAGDCKYHSYGAGGDDYNQYNYPGAAGQGYKYQGYGAGGDYYKYKGYGAGGDDYNQYNYPGAAAVDQDYKYKGYGAAGDIGCGDAPGRRVKREDSGSPAICLPSWRLVRKKPKANEPSKCVCVTRKKRDRTPLCYGVTWLSEDNCKCIGEDDQPLVYGASCPRGYEMSKRDKNHTTCICKNKGAGHKLIETPICEPGDKLTEDKCKCIQNDSP